MDRKNILMFLAVYFFSFSLLKAETIKVMVIDGAVESTHPLLSRIKTVQSFQKSPLKASMTNDHGTHVTGLVIYGAMKKDADRSDEICDSIEVITCQVFTVGTTNSDFLKNELFCLDYALKNNVKYINMSFGGGKYLPKEYDYLEKLHKAGVKIIAAAGNDKQDIDLTPYYPAYYHKVFSNITAVGNTQQDGAWSRTSNYGKGVIKINGENILSTLPYASGGYGERTGTSMAAAIYTHAILKKQCEILKDNNYRIVGKTWAI
jgi:hypothetical protein